MNEIFLIQDNRHLEEFKDKSFCGFKKTEVYKTLFRSIESGQIENACHWLTECMISGYSIDLLDKLIAFSSKLIHINNPKLPVYLHRKYMYFFKSIDNINVKKQKHLTIHFRNNLVLRNLMFDLVSILTISPKTKRYDKYPKINETTEFQFESIKNRLRAQANFCPDTLFKFTDPEELRVVINEIMFHCKNINSGYNEGAYWIAWIFQWEKKNKKMKQAFEIDEREIDNIKPAYKKDVVWLLWSALLYEASTRDEPTKQQVFALYKLFKYEFTGPKRNLRIPIIYHTLGYLTHSVNFTLPLIYDKRIYIQCQCNVNYMFKMKKKHEIGGSPKPLPKKEKRKKPDIQTEKTNDLFSVINDIDQLIR